MMSFEPIAIVGRACVLPGALTPAALWERVRDGHDLVTAAPAERWRVARARVLSSAAPAVDQTWTDRGGYVSGFEEIFNPGGFALPAEEVLALDPLAQWLLHVSREALRGAGLMGGARVGAVFGNLSFPSSSMARYAERVWLGARLADIAGIAPTHARNRFMSGLPAHLVAEALGLGAPAFALDAACASSLYAIKLACDRLHDRSADIMLAGAVNRADDLFIHIGFAALQALSRSGRSRPFHRHADGLVPAEGAGAVVLKRLVDAEAAGDHVFGVIRAVGLSNDGRHGSLVAPSVDGQVRALQAAYAEADLRPREVSLVECHATGTMVGDAAEIRSMRRVFADVTELPIGSLKSNLGHAITVAGVAGLLKVLGAIEAGVRPPTLHVDEPLAEIGGGPFRLLHAAEPWHSDGPRRAAVSAFGFGGNNAHLIVEEYERHSASLGRHRRTPAATVMATERAVAIVGIGAVVGQGRGPADFEAALFSGSTDDSVAARRRAESLFLPLRELRFPPRDLEPALAQHTFILAAARQALERVTSPARERMGAFVGIGCDAEVARYGARWRLGEWAEAWGLDAGQAASAWLLQAASAFAPPLDAASVLGTMPNLPANRLNVQFDLCGCGFTVASEELSGVRALEIAARALQAGELDCALVGAADFSCEPVHEAALRELGSKRSPGDAAVALLVKRAEDARRDGDPILALVSMPEAQSAASSAVPGEQRLDSFAEEILSRFGCAHAAFGLVQVAAAALCCARGRRIGGASWPGARSIELRIEALGGQRATVTMRAEGSALIASPRSETVTGPLLEVRARRAPVVLSPLPAPEHDDTVAGQVQLLEAPAAPQIMAPAPSLAPVLEVTEPASAPAVASAGERPSETSFSRADPSSAWRPPSVANVHRQFLEHQAGAHLQFLHLRAQAASTLLAAAGVRTIIPAPAVLPPAVGLEQYGLEQYGLEQHGLEQHGLEQRGLEHPAPAPTRGLTLDRRGLEIHAAGRIAEIFGPLFAQQDSYSRQVRMPQPPLLLADRLVSLEAEAGSMGRGSLVTETDIHDDSWYLHEGRMPAGLMVEAGQADLLLISYLGVDFLNRGQRVYRLLGCDLTFHGALAAPGDTLRYHIHIDEHAQQGPVRLFFFHYDCHVGGTRRLSVRNGQAGFFTDEELAESMGVLWDPATSERGDGARLDSPVVACTRSRLERAELEAFAAGRVADCFGPGFELGATHTRTPRIAGGRMLLLDEVDELSPRGGPWGRGYLRAVDRISAQDWFFEGHFKNDPCMPGTLMLEGCLQAMALYLTSLGFTLERDGWRFEPVPEEPYRMRCRGQVTPRSRELVYEVFVEEIVAGPLPTLFADILCTVDGLKAFHCRRMGLRLTPGWPLDSRPELLPDREDGRPVASADGCSFGARSLLACAWGRPSDAFGPRYRIFDGPRRVPRLPGPPYHFMSRVTRTDGEMGAMQVGTSIESEYDVRPDAWFFDSNGARTMPYGVLLEAALQPCGWLASYAGSAIACATDVAFRNLDGAGRLLAEVPPAASTIRTRATLTNISRSAGMLIESFDVACRAGDCPLYELKTVFGFFPREALAKQKGLPVPEGERAALAAPSAESVELRPRPTRYFDSGPRLASAPLLMLDRVTGIWPHGGTAGLGRFRAETDVDPNAWFFKAHFFQDPVQPGSLGLEAMLQLLQFAMLRLGMCDGRYAGGRFEPIALGTPLTWKYRGQVLPTNHVVTILLDVVGSDEDQTSRLAIADASLFVDGMRIYEAKGLAMRVVRPTPAAEVLDPSRDLWLRDHCPTWTLPALPLMSMVDRLAAAAANCAPGRKVIRIENARVHRWVPVPAPVRLTTSVDAVEQHSFDVTLRAWRDAPNSAMSRFEPVAEARVVLASEYPPVDVASWDPPAGARPAPDPYESAVLFHGPSFQLVRSLHVGGDGSSALIDAAASGPPRGLLHEVLLDALTHGIAHDDLSRWSPEIPPDQVAYPHRITELRLYADPPRAGQVRCETRFAGFDGETRFPRFRVQASAAGRIFAAFELVEILFPKGPLGCLAPRARRAFLRDRTYVPGARLSCDDGVMTSLSDATVRASDFLPGTVGCAYCVEGDLLTDVAVKEHVAARAQVHPATVSCDLPAERATCSAEPLGAYPLAIVRTGDTVTVRQAGPAYLDLGIVRAYWDGYFGIGRWPVEDLYYGLAERFVRRVRLEDSEAFAALRERSVLYLANHQVAIESLLFAVIVSGLTRVPTVTLAKAEHRRSWLGRLIQHAFTYPGARDPGVITYFDRADRADLPRIIAALGAQLHDGAKSVMVHVEGTRSLSCRDPVIKMSGAFLDMAIASGTPVVPVRFVGGLPEEPSAARLEFPWALGQQDVLLGRPIAPEELAQLPYRERKDRVIQAINALGPPHCDEQPLPGDPALLAAANAWAQRTGASAEHAVILETMRRLSAPGGEMGHLLAGIAVGQLVVQGNGKGRWLAELAGRLFGPRGPKVITRS